MSKKTLTCAEAAERLGISIGTFRKRVKAAAIAAVETRQTGKRGRPALLYTLDQVASVKA